MEKQPDDSAQNEDQQAISDLYKNLLETWNKREAAAYAELFATDGLVIGFDGSQMRGRDAIKTTLSHIFADHETARYVSKVRDVLHLAPDIALLNAVCGMVPAGAPDINPAVNAIQTLIAVRQDYQWQIVLFQNTPAQFHGRPELSEALTSELRNLLKGS